MFQKIPKKIRFRSGQHYLPQRKGVEDLPLRKISFYYEYKTLVF